MTTLGCRQTDVEGSESRFPEEEHSGPPQMDKPPFSWTWGELNRDGAETLGCGRRETQRGRPLKTEHKPLAENGFPNSGSAT